MKRKLDRVVAVRKRRIDSAHKRQFRFEALRKSADDELAAAQQNISQYSKDIERLESKMLAGILQRRITLYDVAQVKEKLQEAERTARELVAKRSIAAALVETVAQKLDHAKHETKFAIKKHESINKLNEQFKNDRAITDSRASDNEADERVILNWRR